jgi:hypothetical protein
MTKCQTTWAELTSPAGSGEATGTAGKGLSAGTEARRRGKGEMIAGKAPDGVGRSIASFFLVCNGRRARKRQRNIQATSTPRSVQTRNICGKARVADAFMNTSFFKNLAEF